MLINHRIQSLSVTLYFRFRTSKPVAHKSRWPIFAYALGCASVLLALVSVNVFPDQTWRVLKTLEKVYADTVSRMITVPTGVNRQIQEDRIYEAVVRDLIESNRLRGTVFLNIDHADLSDEFMARFASSGVTVKRTSEGYIDQRILRSRVDRSTGKAGVDLSMGSIGWLYGDRVEVQVDLICGPLCGCGGIYQLVKPRGRWTVETYVNQRFY